MFPSNERAIDVESACWDRICELREISKEARWLEVADLPDPRRLRVRRKKPSQDHRRDIHSSEFAMKHSNLKLWRN